MYIFTLDKYIFNYIPAASPLTDYHAMVCLRFLWQISLLWLFWQGWGLCRGSLQPHGPLDPSAHREVTLIVGTVLKFSWLKSDRGQHSQFLRCLHFLPQNAKICIVFPSLEMDHSGIEKHFWIPETKVVSSKTTTDPFGSLESQQKVKAW